MEGLRVQDSVLKHRRIGHRRTRDARTPEFKPEHEERPPEDNASHWIQ